MARHGKPLERLSHAEVIARVQAACDDLVRDATRGHRPPVSCRSGCDFCCRQPVFITPLEGVAIRDFVREHGLGDEVARRTRAYLQRMAGRPQARAGLAALLRNVQGLGAPPTPRQRTAVYGVPCPFLVNGLCSIYPARPLMCREHISFDDVGKCERDEPFLGLDKPRFSEVSAYCTMRAVPPDRQMRPVYEFASAAADADQAPPVPSATLRKALRWKTGR